MLVDFFQSVADDPLERVTVEAGVLVFCAFFDLNGNAAVCLVYRREFHCNNVFKQQTQIGLRLLWALDLAHGGIHHAPSWCMKALVRTLRGKR